MVGNEHGGGAREKEEGEMKKNWCAMCTIRYEGPS